ncbi:hypothetical protein ACQ4M4_07605 [Leptolyngbya sp. AN02str]|uniref:hypothetical protein n=1 Tax=Leptolyngbya sp. AN02str TaxID=3423363 RepID=UPI003D323E8B
MTVGGDFIPGDVNAADEPNYPVVFGVKLTPTILGILLALVGLGAALWLLLNALQPAFQENQTLKQDIAEKERQLVDQGAVQQQIDDAQVRLEEAEQLRADVLALFADEESLDTLLLDINERVQSANAGVSPSRQVQDAEGETLASSDPRATLTQFELVEPEVGPDGTVASDVINDSSFGPEVNGKLRERVFDVEMLGTFAQTQSIIRNIERLQPLLVARDFESEVAGTERVLVNRQGQLVSTFEPKLRTSFQLIALIPNEELPSSAQPEIDPTTGFPIDPTLGYPVDPSTGQAIDPATGQPVIDPATGQPLVAPSPPPAPAQ